MGGAVNGIYCPTAGMGPSEAVGCDPSHLFGTSPGIDCADRKGDAFNLSDVREDALPSARKIASVQVVSAVSPVPNAERLEVARILGWNVVIKKGEFAVGDRIVYAEIDAVFPDTIPEFKPFVGKPLRTKRIRGAISQGLAFPLSILPPKQGSGQASATAVDLIATPAAADKVTCGPALPGGGQPDWNIGDDVTDILGLSKYISLEESGQYASKGARSFPGGVPRTDEPRIQSMPMLLELARGRRVVATRKEDGTSCTFVWRGEDIGGGAICGRNFQWSAVTPSNKVYHDVEREYGILEKLAAFNRHIAVQGEIVGPKVNGNRLRLNKPEFHVFNVYDIKTSSYLRHAEVVAVAKMLGVGIAPVIFERILGEDVDDTVDSLLGLAGELEYAHGAPAEGIVVKTDDGVDPRVSFKVISNRFLEKVH